MTEWVAGRIPVLECLRARKRQARRLFLLSEAKGIEAIKAAAGNLPIQYCSRQELNKILPDALHQGVILEADPLPVWDIQDWIRQPHAPSTTLVALDEISDPHNFGAIVRNAEACGANAVLFCVRHAAPITPVVLKSAAGAMEHIDLIAVTNLVRALKKLKETGFWIIALDPSGPQTLWETDLTGKTVFVVGSEGKGVRRLVRETCDTAVRIPLVGATSSLNASVSAGIVLAECLRQKTGKTL